MDFDRLGLRAFGLLVPMMAFEKLGAFLAQAWAVGFLHLSKNKRA